MQSLEAAPEPSALLTPEAAEAEERRIREMNGHMIQFGMGSRTCIGKNISLLEIYKLVPPFLRNFEIALEKPDSQLETRNAWFVRPLNFNTVFKARKVPADTRRDSLA